MRKRKLKKLELTGIQIVLQIDASLGIAAWLRRSGVKLPFFDKTLHDWPVSSRKRVRTILNRIL